MNAPGSIRLGNKRAGAPGKPGPGEIAVDIDRKNRVLGNPFVLHDPTDAAAHGAIDAYKDLTGDDWKAYEAPAEA